MRLPQLTLRDLFWLVALAALGCAWWVDHFQMDSARKADFKFRQVERELMEDRMEGLEMELGRRIFAND
jgi:hypothetical protein